MKRVKMFVAIAAAVFFLPLSPVNAKEGSGETIVGYTSTTIVEIPSGGNGPATGDTANLGNQIVILGISSIAILLLLIGRKREEEEKKTSRL